MKKIVMFLIIFSLFLISCNSNQPQGIKNPIAGQDLENLNKTSKTHKTNPPKTIENARLEVNTHDIKFKGLSLYTSKELIVKKLGEPDKISEPKYECGPFSEAWQEMKFFQFFYGEMNFIVDEKEEATIQGINLKENYKIEVNGMMFDKLLTFKDVIGKLKIKQNKNYDETIIYLIPKPYSDEEYFLIFEDEKEGSLF